MLSIASVLCFYVVLYALSSNNFPSNDMFSLMSVLFSFENQYFLLFFFMSAYSLVEYGIKILSAEIHNDIENSKYMRRI